MIFHIYVVRRYHLKSRTYLVHIDSSMSILDVSKGRRERYGNIARKIEKPDEE